MSTLNIAVMLNDKRADLDNYEAYLLDSGFTVYAVSRFENIVEVDIHDINNYEVIGSIYYSNGRWHY